jgi:hypothetical protein
MRRWITLLWSPLLVSVALAQDAGPSFEREIQPLLAARCGECHNQQKRSGKLNLASAIGIARGGESGLIVAPGRLDDSRLWQKVADEEMPPDQPLAEAERALLAGWIERGAHGLPNGDVGRAGDGRDHWAFQPVKDPSIPPVRDARRARTDLDRFLLAKLEAAGLTLSPEASRTTLIRRVCFDLTGLPPTPAEIAAYLADESPLAYERMLERYLSSPHYGERWGGHWLDAAGYADSNGYFNADTVRPLAYRYRDYVIRSIAADKPLDRFITEQLAGDELAGHRPGADITPELIDLYTATHFLRNAQDGTDSSDGNPDELLLDRYSVLEGTVQIIGASLLGLTFQCARCHDHKFEPITQKEYYQFQAIFYPGYNPDQWVKAAERVVTVGTRAERDAHAAKSQAVDREVKSLRESLAAAAAPLGQQLVTERLAPLPADERDALLAARDKPQDQRSEAELALLAAHQDALEISDAHLDERFPQLAALRQSVEAQVAKAEATRPAPLEQLAVFTEVADAPAEHHVLERGLYRAPGEVAPPGVPQALCGAGGQSNYQIVAPTERFSSGRRLALAKWLTSPDQPLTARVLVNRVWQHHFGVGIVSTSDNLGYTGAEPTHPELLDYLAARFVESGWSLKKLHRLIMTSAVYCQSSEAEATAQAADPKNHWLARFPVRRLDAEALRDAMLAVSGEIDPAMYGPYVPTTRLDDGSVAPKDDTPGAMRRSLYLEHRRTQMPSLLETFDAPIMVTNCSRRQPSTVPLQSLALLNSEFVLARAEALADRLAREAGDPIECRLSHAFLLVYARGPRDDERAAAQEFLTTQGALYAENPDRDRLVWRDLCQMLLASNPFLYVE